MQGFCKKTLRLLGFDLSLRRAYKRFLTFRLVYREAFPDTTDENNNILNSFDLRIYVNTRSTSIIVASEGVY